MSRRTAGVVLYLCVALIMSAIQALSKPKDLSLWPYLFLADMVVIAIYLSLVSLGYKTLTNEWPWE